MPSSRALPDLRVFSRRSIVTPSTLPEQLPIRISSAPITPPARLHLRNILPTSPGGMPTPPPPPPLPCSLIWECHSCETVYRLGCTRRCLVCDHEFCVTAALPKSGRGKKRRRSEMCKSEFDYKGWAEWGAWRRKVLGLEVVGPAGDKIRERAFVTKTHNCETDCDFPSECRYVRHTVHNEMFQTRYMETLVEEPVYPPVVGDELLRHDDGLPLVETMDMEEEEEEEKEEEKEEEGEEEGEEKEEDEEEINLPDSPTLPKSPLSQTSFLWNDSDEEKTEKKKQENAKRKDKKCKTKSKRKNGESSGTKSSSRQENAKSPAVDAEGMDPEELYRLLEEDKSMMPLEMIQPDNSSRQQESRRCRQGRVKHGKRLIVRNLTYADRCEDWDDTTDSDTDDSSPPFSPPPSSASSLDGGEWVPASGQTTPAKDGDYIIDRKLEEELERELEAMIRADKSFLRD
ncbi:hypothetical protein F4776DRAFT_132683 [Hypoxylon sp. NC0597]|nr:hypothetical protein F4776DRAFT_132683 [Hypoxylon sp. NC0597]